LDTAFTRPSRFACSKSASRVPHGSLKGRSKEVRRWSTGTSLHPEGRDQAEARC